METMNGIEQQQIDRTSDEFSPKPSIPAPVRAIPPFQYRAAVRSPSPVLEVPDGFNEEEWLCDVAAINHTPIDHTPLSDEVRQGVLASPENATILPVEHHRKPGKQVKLCSQ